MTTLRLFKWYIVFYFFYPVGTLYTALLTGIKFPAWIELVPVVFLALFRSRFTHLGLVDLLFFLLLLSNAIFFSLNFGDYSWVSNIEIRAFLLIGINYFIFRALLNKKWSGEIADQIATILKVSMYLAIFEFVVINTGDIYRIIEARYLAVYEGSERLYETIIFLRKPIGLYPGTHNLGVAAVISLLYLISSKSIKKDKAYFAVSLVTFFIGFSITASITFLVVYAIQKISSDGISKRLIRNSLYGTVVLASAVAVFNFYGEISQLKAYGELRDTSIVPGDNVYVTSIQNSVRSLLLFPFGTPLGQIDLYENEVYVSRLLIYFGWPIVAFLAIAMLTVVVKFRIQSESGIFFSISFLTLLVSSFHYGSINYYPLTILVPLTFVFIRYHSRYPSARLRVINQSYYER